MAAACLNMQRTADGRVGQVVSSAGLLSGLAFAVGDRAVPRTLVQLAVARGLVALAARGLPSELPRDAARARGLRMLWMEWIECMLSGLQAGADSQVCSQCALNEL